MTKARTAKASLRPPHQTLQPDVLDVGHLLPGISEDEQYVSQAGVAVLSFLKGVAGFFTAASAMEREAIGSLERAKALLPPATMEEDHRIQKFIKENTTARQIAEKHWEVTTLVSAFHRRLTAARARTVEKHTQAGSIATNLHNRYVDDEKRRVAAETERRRVEEEQRAAAERQAELDRLEAAAVQAEEHAPTLSAREQKFVDAYTSNVAQWRNDGKRCAQLAGFTGNLVAVSARLLSLPKIQQAIAAATRANEIREQKAAVAATPVDVQPIETIKPNISRSAGVHDFVTHGAELLDAAALIEAVFAGKYGIPRDVLKVDESKLNSYGKEYKELVNRWPGVKYTKKTGVR